MRSVRPEGAAGSRLRAFTVNYSSRPALWHRHRAGRHDASDSWGDPKHWILVDDPLEVAQWRSAVDRKEWAGAG
jgi:hypothetical protein